MCVVRSLCGNDEERKETDGGVWPFIYSVEITQFELKGDDTVRSALRWT